MKKLKTWIKKLVINHDSFNPKNIFMWRERARSNKLFSSYYHLKYYMVLRKCHSYIPLSVDFSDIPCFPHGIFGVFISAGAKIGTGGVIFHQVTIGSNTLKDSKGFGAPRIGNNVYIGCGAKIIGNVTVGDNVRIGANCVIVEDIPSNSTVVLSKPVLIRRNYKVCNGFEAYKIEDNDYR